MFTNTLVTLFLLLSDPNPAGVCEEEWRIIDDLQTQVKAHEDTILVLDELFLDFASASDPSTGCSTKPTALEQAVCECVAEGHGAGTGLTQCIANKGY
jgi:hypothetical protein